MALFRQRQPRNPVGARGNGGFLKLGVPFWGFRVWGLGLGYHFGGPNNKDSSIFGSILGFWETT